MSNPHEALCPSCMAVICLRCAALENKMSPDGLDGCEDCQRGLKRTQRAMRQHIEKDHARTPAGREPEAGG